jgi:purine-binding chemotaxis protein CheW
MAGRDVLVCEIGTSQCALPLSSVIEIMRPLPIDPIAGSAKGVLGLSIIRGAPTVVVDAAVLLGQTAGAPTRFVMLRTGERRVALAVQGALGIRTIATEALHGLPPLLRDADSEVLERIASRDRDLLLVLEAAHLFPGSIDEP